MTDQRAIDLTTITPPVPDNRSGALATGYVWGDASGLPGMGGFYWLTVSGSAIRTVKLAARAEDAVPHSAYDTTLALVDQVTANWFRVVKFVTRRSV